MRRPIPGGVRSLPIVFIVWWSLAFGGVPEGYEALDGLKDQFTIALPAGWSAYNQNQALSGKPSLLGVVVFSAQAVTKEGETTADPNVMSRVDTGDLPSFLVDRQPAAKGMSCTKFSKSAAYDVGVKRIDARRLWHTDADQIAGGVHFIIAADSRRAFLGASRLSGRWRAVCS